MKNTKLSDFNYAFPKELIAYRPQSRRDQSRLLVIHRKSAKIEHKIFFDITGYLKRDDVIVLNNTKVMPAALSARFVNFALAELLVLEKIKSDTAKCLTRPAKKFKKDTRIFFSDSDTAVVVKEKPDKILRFSSGIDSLLQKYGRMPLPPYIKRESGDEDFSAYQTVYAEYRGAVAAPTAGLHFTKDILSDISKKGIKVAFITLHVGYGTFEPVRCENIDEHKMHRERFDVSQKAADVINDARNNGGRILAVGTTSCRVLETIARGVSTTGFTDLFIYPPYKFRLTDVLLTNFHQPKSTPLMLTAAFCGHDLLMEAYRQAIEKRYRLFSYGDAMLIV